MTHTQIMAILNVTPDSFSDGGRYANLDAVVKAAAVALEMGADILDVGGESTRPGAPMIPQEEEICRVVPAITAIRQNFPKAIISVDTRKSVVAAAAVKAGASIVNDVSGLQYDPALAEVAARYDTALILTHSQGTPETMQIAPSYPRGVVPEVLDFFERQIGKALDAGVREEGIIVDPGFGFGKTLEHNLTLLGSLGELKRLKRPILVGTSRKSFLTLGHPEILPSEREALTAATLALAIERGADYLRVHDVACHVPVVRLTERVLSAHAVLESS